VPDVASPGDAVRDATDEETTMDATTAGGVVVGVDGTDTGLRAVRWAATEARARRTSLLIVHAAPYATDRAGTRRATGILGRAYTVARQHEPGVLAHTSRVDAAVVPALVDASQTAELLVVGMLSGHLGDALVSSMAPAVAAAAGCPVTVVRVAQNLTGTVPRPVVTGVQDVDADAPALDEAFADADRHGCSLVVLHAVPGAPDPDRDARTAAALRGALNPWHRRHPAVPVEVHIGHGAPATALLRLTTKARSVVVGTRGRARMTAALLGSTSRVVLVNSGCPVTVVHRAPRTGPAADGPARSASASGVGGP
jgi:nucleotide-binding universal stress UspA family protein